MILSPFEWSIAKRYMLPGRSEAVIALVAGISITVVMLSVAMLVMAPRLVQALSWPALLVALVLCMKVYWVALLWRGK